MKGNLQSEINHFFQVKNHRATAVNQVTSSAFCKARKKFSESAFIELNQVVNHAFYQQANIQTWHGFRILAVDGSKYHLPNTDDVRDYFGGQTNQYPDEVPMALGSCLYDVFQGNIVDAHLAPYKSSERELAFSHLALTQPGDLTLYDRGYPAFWLFAAHIQQGTDFCMRVKAAFNQETKAFVASGKQQEHITLTPTHDMIKACEEKGLPIQPVTVRLLRVKTCKGEYILMTSLLNKRTYPVKAFKELYHLRWQVEEGYKRQKSWLEIENFTGKSVLCVKQDFYARIMTQTLTAISVFVADGYKKSSIAKRRRAYKINFAQTLSSMKQTVLKLLWGRLSEMDLHLWLKSIASGLSIIRPGRSFERKNLRRKTRKYSFAYKRVL